MGAEFEVNATLQLSVFHPALCCAILKDYITGMARAIIKNNKLKETKEALKQILPQSAAGYAAIRKEEAKPGWWLPAAPDRWVRK